LNGKYSNATLNTFLKFDQSKKNQIKQKNPRSSEKKTAVETLTATADQDCHSILTSFPYNHSIRMKNPYVSLHTQTISSETKITIIFS